MLVVENQPLTRQKSEYLSVTGSKKELLELREVLQRYINDPKAKDQMLNLVRDEHIPASDVLKDLDEFLGVPGWVSVLVGYRENAGLSQKEMACELGVSPQYINSIEKGKRLLGRKKAKEIAEFLNIPSYKMLLED